ncbi:hypothetical protein C8J56DRAFT_911677 [Mycena floridula]|nr:hypothetical protein C8J56DRAFT_911677 [Mycena floridula]
MDSLTSDQKTAVIQLKELLTDGGDDDVAISVLSTVDWDVERAAEMIFGSSSVPEPPRAPPVQRRFEPLDIDDSHQTPTGRAPRPSAIFSYLSYPFRVLGYLFRFVFSILRIPLPHLPFLSLNFYRPLQSRRRPTGRGGPDRWVRELEETTGAICISRGQSGPQGVASGSQATAGPSSLTSRATGRHDESRKYLPDFTFGTYEETLRTCQKELKVGCIVLVSEEHDDVEQFKRNTLTDATFVRLLTDNNFIAWGGDVSDLEAYSASEKLQATTYPFVAFIAMQPARAVRGSSTATPTLTVLSRHQGSTATTAEVLNNHLTSNLLPRVLPYMETLRASQNALERDRILRMQQDQAFADSARKDKERILGKMAQEKQQAEESRIREEEQRRAEAEAEVKRHQDETAREIREQQRMHWRRWSRRTLAPESEDNKVRVAIRMPDGKRIVRRLAGNATLTNLYTLVDIQFIPEDLMTQDDPASAPSGSNVNLEAQFEKLVVSQTPDEWWGFVLVNAYPRKVVHWQSQTRLEDIDCLNAGGGQLVVEMLNQYGQKSAKSEDGYDTEDSE